MPALPADLRERVRIRADDRCEYCSLRQAERPFLLFQVEHITARQHGGETSEANLAWACQHCNLHKGPNLAGVDPLTGTPTWLFNPRLQSWAEHFEAVGPLIVGRTDVGRATVRLLNMNAPRRIELRGLR
jgi:hypothetical protein